MKTSKAIFAVFLLILPFMIQDAIAQGRGTVDGINRSQRPEAGPPPEITFPPYETFTLKNGLKVFLVQDPRPSVTLRLLVRGGNALDNDMTGLADAVADLITNGAGSLSASEFADQIDFIGGNVGASASPDAISVVGSGLKKHFPEVLKLFGTAVMNPMYPEDEIAKYKALQISGLQASKKEADFLATYAVNKMLYGNSPLGHMPTEKSLSSISRDDIVRYHKTTFVPNNATLAVVGDLTPGELKKMLEDEFGAWKAGKDLPPPSPSMMNPKSGQVILVDRPTSVQSILRVVGPGPDYTDRDRTRAFLVNSVLGGGTGLGNRLAMNLRETHAYTYTPYSYFTANQFGGYFVAAADVRNEVTDSALVQLIYEVERMTREPITSDELDLNVKSAMGNYLMSLANPTTTAMRVQSIDFYKLPHDYYDKLVQIYSTTTTAHIQELAKKYFRKQDMNIVVVGKASEVKEKLEAFGEVQVWDEDLNPVKDVSAEDLGITAEQAWAKMLDAMGGKDNLRKVQSISQEGSGSLSFGPQTMEGAMKMTQAVPNKVYQELSVNGMTMQQQFSDGETVAVIAQGQRIPLPAEDQAKILAGSYLFPEARLDELDGSLMLKGTKSLEGKETVIVEMQLPNAPTQLYYIDRASFLPVQVAEEETTTRYFDWVEVGGGIKRPSGMVITLGPGGELKVSNLSYTVNGTVDDKIFQAP